MAARKSPWTLRLAELLVCIIPAAVSMQVRDRMLSGLRDNEFERCNFTAQQETTAGLKIAYILRGESFRGGNLSEHVKGSSEWAGKQFGPGRRLTCGSGTFEKQKLLANEQLKTIRFLESMGYSVDLFGATYECDDATKSKSFKFTVQDGLPTLYNLTGLTLLNKKKSTQISAIRAGFHLVTKYMNETNALYSAVIMSRWDGVLAIDRWACHLADMAWPQDLFTLQGVRNEDNLMVVPQRHIKCFDEFLKKDESSFSLPCCRGHCGGGDCKRCVRNFAKAVHKNSGPRKTLPTCGESKFSKSVIKPIYSDSPDWLPDSDRNCIKDKNKHHDTRPY